MLNNFLNKKSVLIFLLIISLSVLLFNYLSRENSEAKRFILDNEPDQNFVDEKLNRGSRDELNESLKKEDLSSLQNLKKEEAESKIIKIASLKDIKSPFADKGQLQEKNDLYLSTAEESYLENSSLILERNIIAEEIIQSDKRTEINSNNSEAAEKVENNRGEKADIKAAEAETKLLNLNNIELPFELIGIVKNKDNASALISYQGGKYLKREKEKIDIFEIKEIEKKKIIISWQDQERELRLWEAD